MTTKSELFSLIKDKKIILLCGNLLAETRFKLAALNIEAQGAGSVSIHHTYKDIEDMDDLVNDYFVGIEHIQYSRRAVLDPGASWEYSIVCNAHTFPIQNLKKIIQATRKTCFINCTSGTIRDLYHSLKAVGSILPVDWSNKDSFKNDLLKFQFNGELALNMQLVPKNKHFLEEYVKK